MIPKTKFLLPLLICVILHYGCDDIMKEAVTFQNGDITLSGTLYIPEGKGPFPAVVFVHGSGAETRENSSFSAKWFASIGYAALIYDKRGTGKSGGNKDEVNYFNVEDLANDVLAAVTFLSHKENIDTSRIGLHATSQGGWIAPVAAKKSDLINFMVIKSASVTTVGDDRVFERSARLASENFSSSDILEAREMQMVEAKTAEGNDTPDRFTMLFEKNKNKPWFSRVYPGNSPFTKSLVEYRKWYGTVVDFDPVIYLEQIDISIYWIFGDAQLDQKGPVEKSIKNLEKLRKKGKPFTIISCIGEGHNIHEKKYELELYNWLKVTNDYPDYKFKNH